MICFVTFHVDLNRGALARIHQRIRSVQPGSVDKLLPIMFQSASMFHPDCRRIVLTDRVTRFKANAGFEVLRYDVDGEFPILAKSEAWLRFLKQADAHVVFLDADIVFNAGIGALFETDFDVGFTGRPADKWPINLGINFAHGGHMDKAVAFHEIWLGKFLAVYRDAAAWGGDQDAVRDIVGEADFARPDVHVHEHDGFRIMLAPCDIYNYSHPSSGVVPDCDPARKVMHFRGKRKRQMAAYWKNCLRGRG